jgi:hypothetical protein
VSKSGGKKKIMFSQGIETYNTDSPFLGLTMLCVCIANGKTPLAPPPIVFQPGSRG